MTFTTLTFALFLLIVFAVYWLLRRRVAQNVLLLVSSYVFYGWWDWRFCSLMLISSLADYFVGLGLERTDRPLWRRSLLGVSLAVNLGLLGFFKYFNFFVENLAALINSVGLHAEITTLRIILPVGISFYTFQTLSYTIDVYRKRIPATHRFIDFMAFVSFFPQLVAGPIERASHLLPQFLNERKFDYDKAADGSRQILWGLFKKIVIADKLAPIVNEAYATAGDPGMTGQYLAFATVCFAFQIYADFSAYSDIATGTARLFGFDLMRNFAYPYFSQNIAEFWRRWHISLSTWFRDYVYIPLGGNRVSRGRNAFNIMVTFVVSGLWHGASWNFVIWGAINGAGIVPFVLFHEKAKRRAVDKPGGEGWLPRPDFLWRMLLTFAVINLAWVFFRAQTLPESYLIIKKILLDSFVHLGTWSTFATDFIQDKTALVKTALVGALLVVEWSLRGHEHPLQVGGWPLPLRWAVYTGIIWGSLLLGTDKASAFIYFQF